MKSYTQYKPTGLPWVIETPAHWELVRNKTVLSETKAVVGDRFADYDLLSLTKRGVIVRDIASGKGKFPKDFTTYKEVSDGQIIFCLFDVDETPRTVGIAHTNGMITGAYDVFTIRDVNPEFFLYYYITMDDTKALKPLYTSLRKVINVQTFLQTKIPLPPRDEQDQIVRWLDWRTNRINKLVRSKRHEIECLKELKKSVVNEAVTKGGSDWSTISLRKVLKRVTTKGQPNLPLLSVVREHGVIPRNMDKTENHNVIPDDLSGYLVLKEGQFVINKMKAWQGSCGVSPYTGLVSPAYFVFELRFGNKDFFHYAIRSQHYVDEFARLSKGIRVGQWDLPEQELNNIQFLFPSEEEQARIAAFLKDKLKAIDILVEKLKDEIQLILEYKTRIISDAVTGKIDLRNVVIPDYETTEDESVSEEVDEENEEETGNDTN
jgi:type I restriction enzyme S subunit